MEGYNKNAVSLRVWKDRTVKETEKRAEIYLTDEEIDAMYAMKLTGMNEIVRDIFLLGYFSCQRYSDYSLRGDATNDRVAGSIIERKFSTENWIIMKISLLVMLLVSCKPMVHIFKTVMYVENAVIKETCILRIDNIMKDFFTPSAMAEIHPSCIK